MRKSNVCQFITVKELPALGYLYNNVCNDVTCAGMPVVLASKRSSRCKPIKLLVTFKNSGNLSEL